jgi:GntR family transcriptional regulator
MPSHPITDRLAARMAGGTNGPVSQLIVDDLWLAIVEGTLSTAERLPTPRQVAIALGVSPRTVELAYEELERRGVVATRPGEGTFVSLAAPSEAERARHREFAALCRETVDRARALGFDLEHLLDALAEYRAVEQPPEPTESEP